MSDIKNRKAAVELEKLIDKKLDNWDERSCFAVKGVKNLSRSDMDTLQLYLKHFISFGYFKGLVKPLGSISEVLKRAGLMDD